MFVRIKLRLDFSSSDILLERQANLKTGVARLGFKSDISVMFADDARNSIQTQTRAFVDTFGRVKRLENARLDFGRNARAVVFQD